MNPPFGPGQGKARLGPRVRPRVVLGLWALAPCALPLCILPLWAEEAPPPRLSFDLGARLSQSTNSELLASGGQAGLDSALRFGLNAASDTRDQKFRLRLGAEVTDVTGLGAPVLDLSYSRQGANAALQLTASHSDAEVDAEDAGTGTALTATGRVRDSDLSLGLQTGVEGPIGTEVLAQTHIKDYSQTSDPTVYDSTSQTLSAAVTLRNLAGGSLALAWRQTAADFEDLQQTTRDAQSLTLTYDRALDGATRLTASLGQSQAETQKLGLAFAESSGLVGSFGLQRDLGNGTVELGFQSERDANGARQTLQLARDLTLATATFSARLGYSARQDSDAGQTVGEISWTQTLPADSLKLTASRQVALNEDEADTLQSALSAAWSHQLGETARLGLRYGLNEVTGAATGTVDGTLRQSLTASYDRDLTRDWALRAGVTLTQIDRDSSGQARDETVFLSINRTFVLLP